MALLLSGKTPKYDTEIAIHTTTDPEKAITDGGFSNGCSTPTPRPNESSQGNFSQDIVDWDGSDDPENPVNFSSLTKFSNVGIISTLTFITQLASSVLAPGVPDLMAELQSSNTLLASFVVSVYALGLAVGSLVLAPGSELLVRIWACLLFFGFCKAVLVLRQSPMEAVQLQTSSSKRSAEGSLPCTHWVSWILTIIDGTLTVVSFLFLNETYPPVLLKRKTQRLIKKTRNTNLRPKCDNNSTRRRSPLQLFTKAISRPTKMLLFSPTVSSLSICAGIFYGYQYLMVTTFTSVFKTQYRFPAKSSGLSFLGIRIGALLGLLIIGLISDRIVKAKSKPTPSPLFGTMKPEYRLPPLLVGAFFTQ